MSKTDVTPPKKFIEALKTGIYKELYQRKLLTDTQLNWLLKSK
jgi:hypothetical protein